MFYGQVHVHLYVRSVHQGMSEEGKLCVSQGTACIEATGTLSWVLSIAYLHDQRSYGKGFHNLHLEQVDKLASRSLHKH